MTNNNHRKVIDSFIFFNEFDILKLRLSYLKDVVDYFIICESNYTFSGKRKPYYLNQVWDELPEDVLAKIIRIKYEPDIKTFNLPDKVSEVDHSNDHWRLEGEQRDFITRFLQRFDENDIFMLSDADEIPRREVVEEIKDTGILHESPQVANFKVFYYNFSTVLDSTCVGTAMTTVGYALERGSHAIRHERHLYNFIEEGGWHFSYFGGTSQIKQKIRSFSHQEYNYDIYTSEENITKSVENKVDLFHRPLQYLDYDFLNFPENLRKTIKGVYPESYYPLAFNEEPIPVLSVPIVNGVQWLRRLINSIDYPVRELFIVNNNGRGEIDAELEDICKDEYPFIEKIKVCHLPGNIGVAGAWNLAIKSYLTKPYWVICNNDVAFTPGFLRSMVENSSQENVGMVWPPSINPDYIANGLGSFECFLIKESTVQKCGLFDENFYPAYCEDCDYLIRMRGFGIESKFVTLPYYHGDGLSYETGSQTAKLEHPTVSGRVKQSHAKNIHYLREKWGENWEDWSSCPEMESANKEIPYNLRFNRGKYLGF